MVGKQGTCDREQGGNTAHRNTSTYLVAEKVNDINWSLSCVDTLCDTVYLMKISLIQYKNSSVCITRIQEKYFKGKKMKL